MTPFENFIHKLNEKEYLSVEEMIESRSLLNGIFYDDMSVLLQNKGISNIWDIILRDVDIFVKNQMKINVVLEKNKVYSQNSSGTIKKTSFDLTNLILDNFKINFDDKYLNAIKIYFLDYDKIKILSIYNHLNKEY